MGFHRFEDYASHHFNPHLSATRGPVIEGEYMYFRRVTKAAGHGAAPAHHESATAPAGSIGVTRAVMLPENMRVSVRASSRWY